LLSCLFKRQREVQRFLMLERPLLRGATQAFFHQAQVEPGTFGFPDGIHGLAGE